VEIQAEKKFPHNPNIIFMGTPDFAVPSLQALVDGGYGVLAVVTQPDRPKGRGRKLSPSPVKRVALDYQLELLQPEKVSDPQFCEIIEAMGPDLIILVAFGQILKKDILSIPPWGALNIHASLLPKYRGAAPIQWAILNNEEKTGLTAMKMDEGMDTGPILLQEEVDMPTDVTAGQLHDQLSHLSGEFLLRTLKSMAENRVAERAQENEKATYAPKITKEMSVIEWKNSAEDISARIRALDPWPGALTLLKEREIRLFSSRVKNREQAGLVPGRVVGSGTGVLGVETGKGIVEIREAQVSGKKRLPAAVFLRGFPIPDGTLLGT
jgi:methionyl-tRNA formyltransferase